MFKSDGKTLILPEFIFERYLGFQMKLKIQSFPSAFSSYFLFESFEGIILRNK